MLRITYTILFLLLLPISHAITQGFYIDTHYNTTNEDVRLNTGETTGRFYGRVVVLDDYSNNISIAINDEHRWAYLNTSLNWSAVQPVFELNGTHIRLGFAHRLISNIEDVKEFCSWRDLTVNGSDHTTSTYKCSKDYLTLSLHSSDDNYIMHENCAGFNDNVCIEVSRADACNPCGWYTSNSSIISDFLLNSYIYKELLINISTGNPGNWNLWGRYNQIPQVVLHHQWPANATHGHGFALFRDSTDAGRYAHVTEGSTPVIPYNNKFSMTSGADNSSSVVFAGVCNNNGCFASSTAMTGGIKQSDTTNNLAFLGGGIQFNAFYGYAVDYIFYDGYTAVNTTMNEILYDNPWSQVVWGRWVAQTTISNITISELEYFNTTINPTVDDVFDEDTVRTGNEAWNVVDLIDGTGETTYYRFDITTLENATVTDAKVCQWVYNEGGLCGTNVGNCASDEPMSIEVWDNQTWTRTDTLCPTVACAAYTASISDYHVMWFPGGIDALAPQEVCIHHINMSIAVQRSIDRNDSFVTFVLRNMGNTVDYYQFYSQDYSNAAFRPYLNVTYGLPPEPPAPNYDDVVFNTSFNGANLINIAYVSGDANGNREYTAQMNYSTTGYGDNAQYQQYQWYYYFGVKNVSGKNVTVKITNLIAGDETNRWPNMRPVFSFNNSITDDWYRSTYYDDLNYYHDTGNSYNLIINTSNDKMFIATNYPYPYPEVEAYLQTKTSSDVVRSQVLTTSEFGYNITMFNITDLDYNVSQKHKLLVIAGQHVQGEEQGVWHVKGMIDWLTSSDARAVNMTRDFEIKIVMLSDPDSTIVGRGRFAHNGSIQLDPNRMWTSALSPTWSFTNAMRPYIVSWEPDLFIDMHGLSSSAHNQLYYPGSSNFIETNWMNNIANYYPETGSRLAQSTAGIASVEVDNLGVMSLTTETGFGIIAGVVYNRTDYEDWGEDILRGTYDYLGPSNPDYIGEAIDSCTYSAGNWQINLSDDCKITDSVNIGSNCLVLTGAGNFSIESGGSVTAACRRFEPDVLNGNSIFAIKTGGVFNWVI